ncbi:carboxylesterase family protein [Draconibacterium sp. IB214405]|uniref:carboxylesterase/lipase family protein n=1 Tax=Draconibacterium sp. IB214405 TaxID=3097352 RepID=UPI002A0B2C5A|nr:carboxylesterase family protein [Draconibacterium sp. IB214405]MDX8338947.1 carboxylesterase family protein [Draconibacterium sp. IB214405]
MKDFSRRQFIGRTALATVPIILLPGITGCSSPSGDNPIVETLYGKLKGYRENGVNIFKGIPYAGDVSGKNRFQKATPVEPWAGVRDALQLGNPSIQDPSQTYGLNEPEPAENCLFLNIWTPANDGKKRPVMVYNHGGGFQTGSGGAVTADGANLARMYDVVVVETNHRLGLLGFLYLDQLGGEEYRGSGNRGVQDIAVALKWVNENIEEFGGDSQNVMIFGESGGGMKTSCLYAMPEAAPYFNKASIESGPGVEIIEAEDAAQTTIELLNHFNISKSDWKKLLDIPAEKLLEASAKLPRKPSGRSGGFYGIGNSGVGGFGAVKDGVVLPNHPFEPTAPDISKDKPLLTGWNEDEYIFFAMVGGDSGVFTISEDELKSRLEKDFGTDAELIRKTYHEAYPDKTPGEIFIAIRSIMMMGLGSITIAERKTKQGGAPAYLYNFGYKSNMKIPGTEFEAGTMHALDIPFKFYNVEGGMAGTKEDRFEASKNFTSLWTNFARNGKPSAEGQPDWPAFNLQDRSLMRIDAQCSVINDRYKTVREMWLSIQK